MIEYPIQFSTHASSAAGIGTLWRSDSTDYRLDVSIPPDFEGPGGAWSPEDLYAQALTNCFLATFKVLAEKSAVTFERVEVSGQLAVDRDAQKRPVMKAFHFRIELKAPSDEARARRLVEKALQGGFILNSVKTEITHELVVTLG